MDSGLMEQTRQRLGRLSFQQASKQDLLKGPIFKSSECRLLEFSTHLDLPATKNPR